VNERARNGRNLMVCRGFAASGTPQRPSHVGRAGRFLNILGWTLLALGGLLSLPAVADEPKFTTLEVEQLREFQQHEGFRLATLAQTSDVNIRANRLEGRIRRHTHPTSHHFLYLIAGQIELSVGDETRVVGAGDFVIIPRGMPHAMHKIGASEAIFLDVASPPDVGDVIWHE
jgi:mannose-6-phosphate isomerase-like protein (cupin superfamily)